MKVSFFSEEGLPSTFFQKSLKVCQEFVKQIIKAGGGFID